MTCKVKQPSTRSLISHHWGDSTSANNTGFPLTIFTGVNSIRTRTHVYETTVSYNYTAIYDLSFRRFRARVYRQFGEPAIKVLNI